MAPATDSTKRKILSFFASRPRQRLSPKEIKRGLKDASLEMNDLLAP